MDKSTDRQRARRAAILSAARELIAERGYDGVTMRDLAVRSGVAPQTLYGNYESKDTLLTKAVEEHWEKSSIKIRERARKMSGIDRTFYMIRAGADAMVESADLMQVLGSLIPANPRLFMLQGVHMHLHQEALAELSASGGIEKEANIDLLMEMLSLHVGAILLYWSKGQIGVRELKDYMLWTVGNILLQPSRGEVRRMVTKVVEKSASSVSHYIRRKDNG